MTDLPRVGRIAGIDFGTVRIGIAITDPSQTIASPLEIYHRKTAALEEAYFRDLTQREQIVGFVVGLPVHLDGNSSQISVLAEEFGKWLTLTTKVPVVWFDERFTSHAASELIAGAKLTSKRRKALLDKLAAQVLLTAFLDSSRDHPTAIKSIGD